MHSTSGVCVTYYEFPGGPASQTKRSADILTCQHSLALSAPAVSNSLATLHVLIHPWATVELSELVWPLYQETGTTHLVDHIIHGFCRFSLTCTAQCWFSNCLSSNTESTSMDGWSALVGTAMSAVGQAMR